MKYRCAQVGPRGGQCRRKAEGFLDFCSRHNQMVREGKELFCLKCHDDAWMRSWWHHEEEYVFGI